MNTKVTLGILLAGCVCLALFVVVNKKKSVLVELPTSTVETATTSVQTAPVVAKAVPTITVTQKKPPFVSVDSSTLTSTSSRPTLTGTGDIARVGIVIKDASDRGLVGTSDIEVVDGHWQYTTPITLTPGTYTVVVFGAPAPVTASLTITAK